MNGIPFQKAMGGSRDVRQMLASTEELLTSDGDERILIDTASGLNKYLCRPFPDQDLLPFGSSTASVISESGFTAAEVLRKQLIEELQVQPEAKVMESHKARLRRELLSLCGLGESSGIDVLFAASGTDLHRIATRLAGGRRPGHLRAIVVDAAETGSGVPEALRGHRYPVPISRYCVKETEGGAEVVHVSVRLADGRPRPITQIDATVENLVEEAVAEGKSVLLVLVDVSKTGLIAPSPSCALALHRRYGDVMRVLVDACQFRLAPSTLRIYLEQGFSVALTGSKFMSGPVFSGAMLVPDVPSWPRRIAPAVIQPGLLLRWEAALHEMRRFATVPDADIADFLLLFATAIDNRLRESACLSMLPGPQLDRGPLAGGCWDRLPSIFSFIASHSDGRVLSRDENRMLYSWLQMDMSDMPVFAGNRETQSLAARRFQLGQPVFCGTRDRQPIYALRLAASARTIVEATVNASATKVIEEALMALDKAEMLSINFRQLCEDMAGNAENRGNAIINF